MVGFVPDTEFGTETGEIFNMSYLQKRGKHWYVRLSIPTELLSQFEPQREIKRSLRTSSLTAARKLAHIALVEIQQQFFQMRYAPAMQQKPPSKRAYEIFHLQRPGVNALVPRRYNPLGKTDLTLEPHPDIMLIQSILDQGYEPDERGNFDLSKPPQNDPIGHQQAQAMPQHTAPLPIVPQLKVSKAVAEFIDQDIHVEPKTRETKRFALDHLNRYAQNKQCHEVLTPDSLDSFLNAYLIQVSRLEIGTRKGHFKILKAFLRYCVKKHYITKSTLDDISEIRLAVTPEDKFKQEQTANESYTSSELNALLNSFIDNPATSISTRSRRLSHIRTIYYILIAMFTGFRSQTLGQLTKSSFDFNSTVHTLTVRNQLVDTPKGKRNTNKTAHSICLPIVKQLERFSLQTFVKNAPADNIFGATSTLDQRLDAQLVALGMKKSKQRIHSIRGTVSNAYNDADGISTELKELLLGHKIQTTAKHYDTLKQSMKEHPEKIQDKMERALTYKIDFSRLEIYLKDQLEILF